MRKQKKQKEKGNGFKFEPTDGNVIAKTLTTRAGSRMDDNFIKQIGQIYPNSGNPQAGRIYNVEGISPAMDTCQGGNRMPKVIANERIRKLTPKECWRLMGFSDEDFEKAEKVNSNSQLYKQAGNSIVVDVLEELFCMMLDEDGEIFV